MNQTFEEKSRNYLTKILDSYDRLYYFCSCKLFLRPALLIAWIAFAVFTLTACAENTIPAPVIDVNDFHARSHPSARSLKKPPQAQPPHHVPKQYAATIKNPKPAVVSTRQLTERLPLTWAWPTEGKIIKQFSATNKGIDIAGKVGAPIYAASSGRVAYAGNGLRGYGNLIILKHKNDYMSAYAYNRKILVKEGQIVEKGQKIAEMGRTGLGKIMLHFEIRRLSQPVDPMIVLGNSINSGRG